MTGGAAGWRAHGRRSGADEREGHGYWPAWAYCLRLSLYVILLGAMVSWLVIEIVHFTEGGWAG
jgi:hypothetical protein